MKHCIISFNSNTTNSKEYVFSSVIIDLVAFPGIVHDSSVRSVDLDLGLVYCLGLDLCIDYLYDANSLGLKVVKRLNHV